MLLNELELLTLKLVDASLQELERRWLPAHKSVAGYGRDFEVALTSLLADVFNGNKTAAQMADGLRGLIRQNDDEVFVEGMLDSGEFDTEADARDALTDSDTATIESWSEEQLSHVDDFAQAVRDSLKLKGEERTAAQQALFDRATLWKNALEWLGGQGRLSAVGNIMLTFDGEDGEENCPECQEYKGQSHRRDWWVEKGLMARNGNKNFTCGRWDNCHHSFFDKDRNLIAL